MKSSLARLSYFVRVRIRRVSSGVTIIRCVPSMHWIVNKREEATEIFNSIQLNAGRHLTIGAWACCNLRYM